MAFNGGIAVPPGERSAIAQGDTVVLRWNGSRYALAGTDYYNDSALPLSPLAPTAHIENHQGALARIPGTGTNVGSAGDTLIGTTLAGENNQGLRT
ncbi:MAG: hypothetical protein HGA45_21225 [Chloroflexales bacterium]|nr:hypothetical protein [Chloroflexales bacterium]